MEVLRWPTRQTIRYGACCSAQAGAESSVFRKLTRPALAGLHSLIDRRMGRMGTSEPTLRELYERGVDKAETEAATEWRRCFDAAADPMRSERMAEERESAAAKMRARSMVLGPNPQPAKVELLHPLAPTPEAGGKRLRNWTPPVVREVSALCAAASPPIVW